MANNRLYLVNITNDDDIFYVCIAKSFGNYELRYEEHLAKFLTWCYDNDEIITITENSPQEQFDKYIGSGLNITDIP